MISYVLFVNAPLSSQQHYHACEFASAALDAGHRIMAVFFAGDAVAIGNRYREPPADEFNPQKSWRQLSEQHAIELLICSSSAQREGVHSIIDQPERHTLTDGFEIAGLGSFIELSLHADRVLQFGAHA